MDLKNLGMVVGGLVVAVILLSSILVPILNINTEEKKTFENVGAGYEEIGTSRTIVIDSSDGLSITSDGENCPIPDMSYYGSATVVYGSSTIVRLESSGKVMIYGATNSSTYSNITICAAGGNATITIDADGAGTITGSSLTDTTYTFANTLAMISASDTPDYRLSYKPYILENTVVIGGGVSLVDGANYAIAFNGTMDDLTINGLWPSGRTGVLNEFDTVTYNNTDLLTVDAIIVDAYLDNVLRGQATYDYFLAPATIVADNPNYAGAQLAALMNIIPLLVTVGIIVAVVGLFNFRRE